MTQMQNDLSLQDMNEIKIESMIERMDEDHVRTSVSVVDEQKFFLVEPLHGYAPEIGRLLSLLADSRQRTMRCVDGLPGEAVDWELAPNFHTIGSVLYHIAAVEVNWIYGLVLQQEMPIEVAEWFPRTILDDGGNITPVYSISLDGHLYRLDKAHAITLSAFANMLPEDFRRVSTFSRMAASPEMVAQQLLQHEAEHRGQIMSLRTAAQLYFDQKRLGAAANLPAQPEHRLPALQPPMSGPAAVQPKLTTTPQSRLPKGVTGPHPLHRGELPEILQQRTTSRSPFSRLWQKLTGRH
jgi:uncharacterized damage-inducible protein DinB